MCLWWSVERSRSLFLVAGLLCTHVISLVVVVCALPTSSGGVFILVCGLASLSGGWVSPLTWWFSLWVFGDIPFIFIFIVFGWCALVMVMYLTLWGWYVLLR